MPELRQNIATREWVIVATDRAKRPEDFVKKVKDKKEIPQFVESCPFCPGNEKLTPPETFSIKDGKGWKIRVTPNKFAALSSEGKFAHKEEGIIRWMNGVGNHEVIVETPRHDLTTALLEDEQVAGIINAYKNRYNALMNNPAIEAVVIFKNHGAGAGTSLEHPHSQVVATPIVPSQVRSRIGEAMRYYDDHRKCVFCTMLGEEIRLAQRVIIESNNFVGFIPYAALSPFHIWILPKRHVSSFPEITDEETRDLAITLKTILAKIYHGLDNPDFNYIIRSLPGQSRSNDFFHWYMSIVPRVTKVAGFELGSGMFINVALPEKSAAFLRDVKV